MISTLRFLGLVSLAVVSVNAVPQWGQCGGTGYTGPTNCDSGLTCVKLNDWYSQCQVSTNPPPPVSSTFMPPPVSSTVVVPPPPASSTSQPPPASTIIPAPNIPAGQLTQLRDFGSNPTNVGIHVYKPSSIRPGAGLLVALHPCGGTAQQYFSSNAFRSLADQRGFLVFYGQAPANMNCWDITSNATLTHDAGGDSLGVASAVRYAIRNWGINPDKVFVTGTSSGAMMTNVMAGAYPDLFKKGAVYAGTGFKCLVTNGPTNPPDPCAAGRVSRTPQEWGDYVRAGYRGFSGPWPQMMIWHGTSDPVLNIANFQEQIKQWTNVHGISQTATSTNAGTPKNNWTKTTYGTGQVIGFVGQGSGHGLPESQTEVTSIDWFGL